MAQTDYVLVTPARNEAALIGRTIESIVAQTIWPERWVIVSDSSTDATDEIVSAYAKRYSWIRLVRVQATGKRSFSSKVNAFRMSAEQLRDSSFEYIGNVDADVTFPPDYYEQVLRRFEAAPKLGIAGGIIHELVNGEFQEQRTSLNSVAGAVQLFRRSCYEDIGGYVPLRFGGIDSAAEIMARMHDWDVETFPDLAVQHHRRVSGGAGGMMQTKFRYGLCHYSLGYHPVFELVRCGYRLVDRPYVAGSVLMMCGYLWAWLTRMDKGMTPDVVRYLRSEQADRLRTMFQSVSMRRLVERS